VSEILKREKVDTGAEAAVETALKSFFRISSMSEVKS
jgi:hypothetical protein